MSATKRTTFFSQRIFFMGTVRIVWPEPAIKMRHVFLTDKSTQVSVRILWRKVAPLFSHREYFAICCEEFEAQG